MNSEEKFPMNFRWVIKGELAIGGREGLDPLFLQKERFAVVSNLSSELQSGLKRKKIPFVSFKDLGERIDEPNRVNNAERVLDMIQHRISTGNPVYLCCKYGYSLSPTIAVMYLVERRHMKLDAALAAVKIVTSLHQKEITKRYLDYSGVLRENTRRLIHEHREVRELPPVVYQPVLREIIHRQMQPRKMPKKTFKRPRRR